MEFYFPNAVFWMWDYCIPLGKFQHNGKKYDLGFYKDKSNKISHAIVYGDEPGDYISGEFDYFTNSVICKENIRRYNMLYRGGT